MMEENNSTDVADEAVDRLDVHEGKVGRWVFDRSQPLFRRFVPFVRQWKKKRIKILEERVGCICGCTDK